MKESSVWNEIPSLFLLCLSSLKKPIRREEAFPFLARGRIVYHSDDPTLFGMLSTLTRITGG